MGGCAHGMPIRRRLLMVHIRVQRKKDLCSAVCSADGTRIVSWNSQIEFVELWDAQLHRSITYCKTGGYLYSPRVMLAQKGRRFITEVHYPERLLNIWDTEYGAHIAGPLRLGKMLDFSPDGLYVVCQDHNNSTIGCLHVISVDSTDEVSKVDAPDNRHMVSAKFSWDGLSLVYNTCRTCYLWNTRDHTIHTIITEPTWTSSLNSRIYSTDGRYLASASDDETKQSDLMVWSLPIDKPSHVTIRSDGWAVDSQSRVVFWVPTEIRKKTTECSGIVIEEDSGDWLCVDYNDMVVGDEWTLGVMIYIPSTDKIDAAEPGRHNLRVEMWGSDRCMDPRGGGSVFTSPTRDLEKLLSSQRECQQLSVYPGLITIFDFLKKKSRSSRVAILGLDPRFYPRYLRALTSNLCLFIDLLFRCNAVQSWIPTRQNLPAHAAASAAKELIHVREYQIYSPIMFAHTAVTLLLSLTAAGSAHGHSTQGYSHAIRQDPHAIPPLAEITAGMPIEPAVPLSATPTAGSPAVISGAPNLPPSKQPLPDMSSYPPGGQMIPTDSPEVKEWLAEIAASGVVIPNTTPYKPLPDDAVGQTLCSLNPEATTAGGADGTCWWSCSSCTRDTDVVTCPDKLTPKVLNYLAEKNLKASFYVIGANVVNHPEILQATYLAGHELGWTRKVIQAVLGVTPRYFRPPYGDYDRVRAIAKGLGMTPVIWTQGFDTDDWSVNSGGVATELMNGYSKMLETLPTLNNGVISLQHDWYQATVDLAVGHFLPAALSHNPAPNFQSVIECQHQPLGMSYVETSGSGTPAGPANNATTTPAPSAPASSTTVASGPTTGASKPTTTGTPSSTASGTSVNSTSANGAVTTRGAMSRLFAVAIAVVVGVLA
ncbi:chitin deacetylase [Rhizoctonia solani AG-1 IA]|uniref:chitin deacetylase n=1 Tax=Thanatephorus cucumeris (strain AG1-IA) TaxID=983506 RepID=L8WLG3_THACA|nr:chitin deacetylase [Rhizoctonia solani AG-1 IA]